VANLLATTFQLLELGRNSRCRRITVLLTLAVAMVLQIFNAVVAGGPSVDSQPDNIGWEAKVTIEGQNVTSCYVFLPHGVLVEILILMRLPVRALLLFPSIDDDQELGQFQGDSGGAPVEHVYITALFTHLQVELTTSHLYASSAAVAVDPAHQFDSPDRNTPCP
jgi:hypothetical protein